MSQTVDLNPLCGLQANFRWVASQFRLGHLAPISAAIEKTKLKIQDTDLLAGQAPDWEKGALT